MLDRKLTPRFLAITICGVMGQFPAHAAISTPQTLVLESLETPKKGVTQTAKHADEGQDLTLSSLEKIQAETIIAEAQVARAKALKSLEDSGSPGSATNVTSGQTVMDNNVAQVQSKATSLPKIKEIYGAGNRLIARLVLGDGSYAELTVGQQVPRTHLKIVGISAREVRVSALDGTGEQPLSFN